MEHLSGKQVAVEAGTTGRDYAKENFTDAEVVEFPALEAAFTALRSGEVYAVFIDAPVVTAQAESGDVKHAAEVHTEELYGIGVQKDDDALLEAIDEQLAAIVENGTYEEFFNVWFPGAAVPEGFRASAQPARGTPGGAARKTAVPATGGAASRGAAAVAPQRPRPARRRRASRSRRASRRPRGRARSHQR